VVPEPGIEGGWFGQGRLSGECHYAGQPINTLTGKMVVRCFVVGQQLADLFCVMRENRECASLKQG
jgi:hypothetical protein